jgi:hypothetical protein
VIFPQLAHGIVEVCLGNLLAVLLRFGECCLRIPLKFLSLITNLSFLGSNPRVAPGERKKLVSIQELATIECRSATELDLNAFSSVGLMHISISKVLSDSQCW